MTEPIDLFALMDMKAIACDIARALTAAGFKIVENRVDLPWLAIRARFGSEKLKWMRLDLAPVEIRPQRFLNTKPDRELLFARNGFDYRLVCRLSHDFSANKEALAAINRAIGPVIAMAAE
jgi:hypothetical protein